MLLNGHWSNTNGSSLENVVALLGLGPLWMFPLPSVSSCPSFLLHLLPRSPVVPSLFEWVLPSLRNLSRFPQLLLLLLWVACAAALQVLQKCCQESLCTNYKACRKRIENIVNSKLEFQPSAVFGMVVVWFLWKSLLCCVLSKTRSRNN